ncbi:barstar family protein [Pantoea sp. FN060301]|uniref:barstar family protein n=1 Tax=Pantoea sp. FN060301 TaxID=3420380 RepID=UPI003D18096A
MKCVTIDFRETGNIKDFYAQFARHFAIEGEFGANLDALWDALTGMIALPARITLRHLHDHEDPAQFADAILVMREAETALDGLFQLRVT